MFNIITPIMKGKKMNNVDEKIKFVFWEKYNLYEKIQSSSWEKETGFCICELFCWKVLPGNFLKALKIVPFARAEVPIN